MSHLHKVRKAHSLRVGGKTWQDVADGVGVSIPTARKLVAEYEERRKARTLFEDQPDRDVDLYKAASIRIQGRKMAYGG